MKSAPLDFFFATTPRKGVVKIKIIDRGLGTYQKIALESDTICYGEKEIDAFLSRVVVQGKLQCLSWHSDFVCSKIELRERECECYAK